MYYTSIYKFESVFVLPSACLTRVFPCCRWQRLTEACGLRGPQRGGHEYGQTKWDQNPKQDHPAGGSTCQDRPQRW